MQKELPYIHLTETRVTVTATSKKGGVPLLPLSTGVPREQNNIRVSLDQISDAVKT